MGMGPMALTCLLLTIHGAGTPEAWPLNQRGFKIPVRIKAEKRAALKGLILYLSTDQGQTWNVQERGTPDKEAFLFTAPRDGTYWFTVATVNERGEEEPRDVMTTPPMQKVFVDTTRPEVRILSAERRGSEVAVVWHVQEDHPDPSSLRVEYRTADMPEGQWLPVNVVPGGPEQVAFRPTGGGEMLVRVQAKDLAGNRGEAMQAVAGGVPVGAAATPAGAIEPAGGNLLVGQGDGGRKPVGVAPARPVSSPVPEKGPTFDNALMPSATSGGPTGNPPPALGPLSPPPPAPDGNG